MYRLQTQTQSPVVSSKPEPQPIPESSQSHPRRSSRSRRHSGSSPSELAIAAKRSFGLEDKDSGASVVLKRKVATDSVKTKRRSHKTSSDKVNSNLKHVGPEHQNVDHNASLTNFHSEELPTLSMSANNMDNSMASLGTMPDDSLKSLAPQEEPLGGDLRSKRRSSQRKQPQKAKGAKSSLLGNSSATSFSYNHNQDKLGASYNSILSMTEAETEHSSSGDDLFLEDGEDEEQQAAADLDGIFRSLSQESDNNLTTTAHTSSTAQAVAKPLKKKKGTKSVDEGTLRKRVELTLAMTSDDDDDEQPQKASHGQRRGRRVSSSKSPMKDSSTTSASQRRRSMKDTSTKSANGMSARKSATRASMKDTSTSSQSLRKSKPQDKEPMMDWSNNKEAPMKDNSKQPRKRRTSVTKPDSSSTGTEEPALLEAKRSSRASLRKKLESQPLKDKSGGSIGGSIGASSRQQRRNRALDQLNESKSSLHSSSTSSSGGERRPARRTKTAENPSSSKRASLRRTRTTEPVPPLKECGAVSERRTRTTEAASVPPLKSATAVSERGRRSNKKTTMDDSSNKDHSRRRSPSNKRKEKKKANPQPIHRSITSDGVFRATAPNDESISRRKKRSSVAATTDEEPTKSNVSSKKALPLLTRSRTGDAVLGRMSQMIKRVNSRGSSRHQRTTVASPFASTTTTTTTTTAQEDNNKGSSKGTPKRSFSNGMGMLRRPRSKSRSRVSRVRSSSISNHQRAITGSSKQNKFNIIGSDIVSDDYIYDQLTQVEENPNIVVLELEDFLLGRRDSMEIPEKLREILSPGENGCSRPWEGIHFVDELVDGFTYRGFKRNRKRFLKGMDGICAQNLISCTYKTKINVALDNVEEEPTRLGHLVKLLDEFQKDPSVIALNIRTNKTTPDLVRALGALLLCGKRNWEGVCLELGGISSSNTAIQSLQRAANAKEIDLELILQDQ